MRRLIAIGLLLAILPACDRSDAGPHNEFGGNAKRGKELVTTLGCGSCHDIPGIGSAHGLVGPPLGTIGKRTILAGLLPNTPDNMITWLKAPQSVVPGNAMPNMELDDAGARDIAAYLYTLR